MSSSSASTALAYLLSGSSACVGNDRGSGGAVDAEEESEDERVYESRRRQDSEFMKFCSDMRISFQDMLLKTVNHLKERMAYEIHPVSWVNLSGGVIYYVVPPGPFRIHHNAVSLCKKFEEEEHGADVKISQACQDCIDGLDTREKSKLDTFLTDPRDVYWCQHEQENEYQVMFLVFWFLDYQEDVERLTLRRKKRKRKDRENTEKYFH